MPVIVSLLRAVNLAGHNKIKMDALRDLYASLKLSGARTYVQSGNVVFTTEERDLDDLARRMESAIEKSFGFRADVMLRTAAQMRAVVAKNPFSARRDIAPNHLVVVFLAGEPRQDACDKLLDVNKGPEEIRTAGREAYIYYVNGIGRSKLTAAVIERSLGTRGTARNWNTVTRLLEMADEFKQGGL